MPGERFKVTNLSLFFNTALLALGSAVLAGVVGYVIAPWLHDLKNSARIARVVLLLPFVMPALLFGIALLPIQNALALDSNFGMLWVLMAHVIMNAGYLANVIAANAPRKSIHEAAAIDGASVMKLRYLIELPILLPALAPALLLVALYSATSFGLVRTLGQGLRTLETEIAHKALQDLDLQAATSLALLQTLLTALMFWTSRVITRTRLSETGVEIETRLHKSIASKIIGFAFIGLLLLILGSVVARSFQGAGLLHNLGLLAGKGSRDILNVSVVDAGLNSLRNMFFSLSIALPISWIAARGKQQRLWPLIPVAISPVVWGLLTLAGIGYLPRSFSSSWVLLPTVQALFLIPLLYQLIHPARASFSSEIADAAKIDGASGLQLHRFVTLPLIWPNLRIALSLGAIAALGEFGAASFLAMGDQATLPVVLFRLISRPGEENYAMALTTASLFILLSAYVLWIANRETRNLRQVI